MNSGDTFIADIDKFNDDSET